LCTIITVAIYLLEYNKYIHFCVVWSSCGWGALGRERTLNLIIMQLPPARRSVWRSLTFPRGRKKDSEKNKNSVATTVGERAGLRLCGETRAQTMLGINRDSAAAVCADLVTPPLPALPHRH